MLNKFFIICSLTVGAIAGIQAYTTVPAANYEQATQAYACDKCGLCDKCGQRDLTPGILVCNQREDRCLNEEGDNTESASSHLFADFCDHQQEDDNLLACKDCQ